MVAWVSKAWTDYERQLPVFYREALGRLLCLEHFRNLIETQDIDAGTTVYTDHAPSTYVGSLSNKGRLSTWKIHETSDLIATVQTLYKAGEHLGPPHGLADPLSRLPRGNVLHRLQLPALLKILMDNLPPEIKELRSMRVNAEKDTTIAARIVQRWRTPTNPISTIRGSAGKPDFLIVTPYADKITHQVADYIRRDQPFAALVPTDLLNEIEKDKNGKIDEQVKRKRQRVANIVVSSVNLTWLISWPGLELDGNCKILFSKSQEKDTHVEDQPDGFDMMALKALNEEMSNFALTRSQARQRDTNRRTSRTASVSDNGQAPCQRHQRSSALDPLSFSSSPRPEPLSAWVGKQSASDAPPNSTVLTDSPGLIKGLMHVKGGSGRLRILVPESQRVRLIKQEHQVLLHVGSRRVLDALEQRYYWPNMKELVHEICTSCPDCQKAKVRRQQLHKEFKEAGDKGLPLPRQQYGIDFYGHANGEILVAIDLCTREVLLWFLRDRKQDTVARALLTGLIFQKGVPMVFRSDEASEFVGGVVAAMNTYLGIEQISTGGYNPRANAIAERFMATLGHMLRVCSDSEYKNIQQYLQCIAFAHNCTFNSQIEATPFEVGHGLPARTVTEARMSLPKLSLTSEEGMPVQISANWEKSVHVKTLELATRLATVAQAHSQWHRRKTAQKLNQAGKTIDESLLKIGDSVYFYRPPSQNEVLANGRKKKHLYHYHGPARIVKKLRDRQYEIEYTYTTKQGKSRTVTFQRDASMLVPEKHSVLITEDFDPMASITPSKPVRHDSNLPLEEGEVIICKDDPRGQEWYLAEVKQVLPRQLKLQYFSAYTPALENHAQQSPAARGTRLRQTRFRRTWFIRSGKHRGKATLKPPFPHNPSLRTWEGPLFDNEYPDCILVRNVQMDAEGRLSEETINLAQELEIPHARIVAVEDEQNVEAEEGTTPPLFLFAQQPLCECSKCTSLLSKRKRARAEKHGERPHSARNGKKARTSSLAIQHPVEQ